ncbi:VWA domain-containing protein [Plantibacter sp. LMC-P-059a]|jgi:Ca-activated chloride channel family protein|uniref:VWA domain-containing protein n=1 Tax=Plantibacter sp. LMC-P-059a TaxID=3040297 RepID=UPI0025513766|nr:VWA domain-containing protein [Plantibacter sp. LMC-P-059a]
MTINPVLPIWALAVFGAVLAAFAGWQFLAGIRRPGAWHWLARLAMVLVLVVIALRPTIPGNHRPPSAMGDLDVYFVVDTTSSMAAEDWTDETLPDTDENGAPQPPTRLDGAKADITGIADRLAGARYALVTFDAVTVQRMPLTTDATALRSATEAMTQEVTTYSRGSSIDEPVEYLTTLLTKAEEQEPGRNRIVFYLGDGEQTSGTQPESFESIAPLIGGGGVLGYGTEAGGTMREFSGYQDGSVRYIQDYSTGEPAVSRLDPGALETIASQLGVKAEIRTPGAALDDVVDGLAVGGVTVQDEVDIRRTDELYWVFALAFGALLLTEIPAIVAALGELRRTKGSRA